MQYKHGGDIYSNEVKLDFSVNVNPQGIPRGVLDAAAAAVADCASYPDPDCRKLVEGIAKKEDIPKEWIICGNGAADLIYLLAKTRMPKRAMLLAPGFSDYAEALRSVECGIGYHYLKENERFQLQENIINSLTKDMDMLILCNPNNPTGQLIPQERLLRIIRHCGENGTFVLLDECFLGFVKDADKRSLVRDLGEFHHVMVLSAFTKLYACAGLRLGYAVCADTSLLKKMRQYSQSWPVSIPAQAAGLAALEEVEYAKNTLELISMERQYLIDELEKLSVKTYPSAANFILFYHTEKLYDRLLEKGILIRACYNYPGLRMGYYRIAVKRHDENKQLISAVKEILQGEQ